MLYGELIEQDKQEQIIRTRLDDLVSLCPCCFPIYTEKLSVITFFADGRLMRCRSPPGLFFIFLKFKENGGQAVSDE